MAASPPPSSSAVPPSSPSSSSSSSPSKSNPNATSDLPASSPSPASTAPSKSNPNATSDPPASSPPPASTAPPPSISSPPPSIPASPPPSSPPPPVVSAPPPSSNAPPPSSNAPPPASPTLPPPTVSSPPPAASPPKPALSPPPSSQPSPPSQPSSPPPASPPPVVVSPPPPAPSASPPNSPPSQPPPSADPPAGSPPPPVSHSPPPSPSQIPPSSPSSSPPPSQATDPSAPPPKNASPTVPSPASPPPSNSSSGGIPSVPSVPSSPTDGSASPLRPPTTPPADSANATIGTGGSKSGGSKTGAIVPTVLIAGLVVLILLGLAVWYTRRRRKQVGRYNAGFVMPTAFSSSQNSEVSNSRSPTAPLVYYSSGSRSHGLMNSPPNPGLGNSKSWFTYGELYNITDGFSAKNLLGEGGFGCVYKGCLADGREVAVKQLKVGGGQGEREFKAEVEIISRVHHRHLVSLVGYCIAESQRLLVYDFVPNDTLDYHLHKQRGAVLSWPTRVKIAAGAARGIAYLHEDCHPRIIHRDIKSSNILLDNNFDAQVADFGLAKLTMDAATHVTTRVMGTFGYMAPEYASSGKLTDRSDVYSFGVVLLELITGRKPVDQSQPLGEESLVEWARPLLTEALDTRDFGELPDLRLENNYNENEMFRMIEAAAACVRHSAAMRPKMGLVVRALDNLTESDINNGVIPGQSELFAAPQSAEIRMFQRMAFGNQDYSDDFTRSSWRSRADSETGSYRP